MAAELSDIMAALSSLHLHDTAAIALEKAEPDFLLHLDSQHIEGSDAKIAGSSTNNSVRLYTRSNLAYTHSIQGHTKPLTGVRFSPSDPNLLFTSSLDGTIKCWDLRKDNSGPSPTAVQTFEGFGNVFTAFDLSCDGRKLCAGTEAKSDDVQLIFWDCRKSERLGVYADSHQDDITQVRFHPSIADRLISGSADGLVCLFDVSQADEDDAIVQTFNPDVAVGKIGYCGKDNSNIYCITTIETLHVWDTVEYDTVMEIKDVRDRFAPVLPLDYIVDCFHVSPPTTDQFSLHLLAGTYSGNLHVLEATTSSLTKCFSLSTVDAATKGHSALVRCMDWNQKSQSLVTGGEDSLVCSWNPTPASKKSAPTNLKAKSAGKIRSKSSGKLKHKRGGP